MGGKSANKAGYFDKLKGLLEEYKSIFIVTVDNVSSQQMHEIRQSMRETGVVLMGKNTMVSWHSDYNQLIWLTTTYRSAVRSRVSLVTFQSTSAFCHTSRVSSVHGGCLERDIESNCQETSDSSSPTPT